MSYNAELAQVNDRVARLAARVAALDGQAEDPLHPAVMEDEAGAEVVAAAYEQLPNSRTGRLRSRPSSSAAGC